MDESRVKLLYGRLCVRSYRLIQTLGENIMFLLGIIYLVILIIAAVGTFWDDARVARVGGFAQFVLFVIIGFVLFWSILNK